MVDPIADMLNRIVNAQAVKKETVEVPFSQLAYAIAKILEKQGFIKSADFKGRRSRKMIELKLDYEDGLPRIEGVKRISKPGQRSYAPAAKLPRAKSGHGITIISTSKGIMTNFEAQNAKVGGEVLCEVW